MKGSGQDYTRPREKRKRKKLKGSASPSNYFREMVTSRAGFDIRGSLDMRVVSSFSELVVTAGKRLAGHQRAVSALRALSPFLAVTTKGILSSSSSLSFSHCTASSNTIQQNYLLLPNLLIGITLVYILKT